MFKETSILPYFLKCMFGLFGLTLCGPGFFYQPQSGGGGGEGGGFESSRYLKFDLIELESWNMVGI